MKINEINESTTSGAIASVASPLLKTQTRSVGKGVYDTKNKKPGTLFTGKKTKKKFVNSISEGKMKELSYDLENLSNRSFKSKYGETKDQKKASLNPSAAKPKNNTAPRFNTKQEVIAHFKKMGKTAAQGAQAWERGYRGKKQKEISEAQLDEEDKIISPAKAKRLKTGLHGKQAQPKFIGFTPPFKASGIYVSDKRGNQVGEFANDQVASLVAQSLNNFATANESTMYTGGVVADGGVNESDGALPNTDLIQRHLNKAYNQLRRHQDRYGDFETFTMIYRKLLSSLATGGYPAFSNRYEKLLAEFPDATSELIDTMFEVSGLDNTSATIEDYIKSVSQKKISERLTNESEEKTKQDGIWQETINALSAGHPDLDPADSLYPIIRKYNISFDYLNRLAQRKGYTDIYSVFNDDENSQNELLSEMHDEDEYNSELYSGCYVKDKHGDSEIFMMHGDPLDRRVRIEDKHGRGWYISPKRLTLVSDNDPKINVYFPDNQ